MLLRKLWVFVERTCHKATHSYVAAQKVLSLRWAHMSQGNTLLRCYSESSSLSAHVTRQHTLTLLLRKFWVFIGRICHKETHSYVAAQIVLSLRWAHMSQCNTLLRCCSESSESSLGAHVTRQHTLMLLLRKFWVFIGRTCHKETHSYVAAQIALSLRWAHMSQGNTLLRCCTESSESSLGAHVTRQHTLTLLLRKLWVFFGRTCHKATYSHIAAQKSLSSLDVHVRR